MTAAIWMLLLLFALPGAAQNVNTSNKPGPMGLQVNTLTGNLFIPRNDLLIRSRGLSIAVTFYYNSFNYDQNIGFGKGWSLNYSIRYRNDSSSTGATDARTLIILLELATSSHLQASSIR
jgi:hypothetical protein